jgi:hypothetical protein
MMDHHAFRGVGRQAAMHDDLRELDTHGDILAVEDTPASPTLPTALPGDAGYRVGQPPEPILLRPPVPALVADAARLAAGSAMKGRPCLS